jgi:hypothetical protein
MPEMFQQALWLGRTGAKGEEQEVAQDLENRDRTRKSSVPVLFRQFERGQMKGTGSSNPPLSASQSALFAFSAENSKIVRMFAKFVRFKGHRRISVSAGSS